MNIDTTLSTITTAFDRLALEVPTPIIKAQHTEPALTLTRPSDDEFAAAILNAKGDDLLADKAAREVILRMVAATTPMVYTRVNAAATKAHEAALAAALTASQDEIVSLLAAKADEAAEGLQAFRTVHGDRLPDGSDASALTAGPTSAAAYAAGVQARRVLHDVASALDALVRHATPGRVAPDAALLLVASADDAAALPVNASVDDVITAAVGLGVPSTVEGVLDHIDAIAAVRQVAADGQRARDRAFLGERATRG